MILDLCLFNLKKKKCFFFLNFFLIFLVLGVLCDATEFDQLPVRHNEDHMNEDLAKNCPLESSNSKSMESPNTKTFLLLQAHFSRLTLPCSDYYTDLKSVLDQTIRILQVKILKIGKFINKQLKSKQIAKI